MIANPDILDDDGFLAADYALGTLDGASRAAAERRMRRDAGFAGEVAAWSRHLEPLLLAAPLATPVPSVWTEIEAGLPRARASAPVSRAPRALVPAFWRWLALGAGGLAAASIAALAVIVQPGAPSLPGTAPSDPASLTLAASTITSDADGSAIYAVVLDPAARTATLVPIRIEVGEGHVPELWIARDGGAPRSLGVFEPGTPIRLGIDYEHVAGDLAGDRVAISLEPLGGSPTGSPTGPVLGHGTLSAI